LLSSFLKTRLLAVVAINIHFMCAKLPHFKN
jgi:hypothetical protein